MSVVRKYPPQPVPPPSVEKFTVWTIYREMWWSVRSFDDIEDARLFARTVLKGGVLITHQRTTHEFFATETI